jgi:hypothetical protein
MTSHKKWCDRSADLQPQAVVGEETETEESADLNDEGYDVPQPMPVHNRNIFDEFAFENVFTTDDE